MKLIKKFNKHQKLIELTNGSQWFINGVPQFIKELISKREYIGFGKKIGYFNVEDFLSQNSFSVYHHNSICNSVDDNPLGTITSELNDEIQPRESTVRNAMIWSRGYAGEKFYYAIKSGGESNSDHLYSSSYCPTIIGEDFNDKRILLINRYSKTFNEVLIDKDIVEELYNGSMNSNQKTKAFLNRIDNACHAAFSAKHCIRYSGKTKIEGAENWTADQVFNKVFEGLKSDKVISLIDQRIKYKEHGLDHHFGKDRQLKIIHQPKLGEDPNDPAVKERLMNDAIKHFNYELNAIKDWKWVKNKYLQSDKKPEGVQIALFSA